MNPDIERSLQLVIDTYKGFREELLGAFGHVDFSLKPDKSQVTDLDKKVEITLKAKLESTFPQFGFQGEETGKTGNTDEFWLVDPIDGTSSFIRGLANSTNMAAFIVDKQPVAAVIYNFVLDDLYTAIAGQGADWNGKKMSVSSRPIDSGFVDNMRSTVYTDVRNVLISEGIRVHQPAGASGQALSSVASGKIEGVVNINSLSASHDNAPGILMIKESGGTVVNLESDSDWDIYTNSYAAGSPAFVDVIHKNLEALKLITRNNTR